MVRHMNSLLVPIRCCRCGGPVDLVNDGQPVDGGRAINGVVRCIATWCRAETAVHVRLMDMGVYADDGLTHGTANAFQRHRTLKERACQDCLDWHSRRNEDNKQKRDAAKASV